MSPSSPPDDTRLDAVFHALADPTRRSLVARLAEGTATITELAEPFRMSLPAVSKHIGVLERAQLVRRRVHGRVHHCSLEPEALRYVDGFISRYRPFWEGTLDSLARYIEREHDE
jgi:DNA-binding transcriptional ArsR family regulator